MAVNLLFKYKANPNIVNRGSLSLLHAAKAGNLDILDLLLRAEADASHRNSYRYNTLHFTIK